MSAQAWRRRTAGQKVEARTTLDELKSASPQRIEPHAAQLAGVPARRSAAGRRPADRDRGIHPGHRAGRRRRQPLRRWSGTGLGDHAAVPPCAWSMSLAAVRRRDPTVARCRILVASVDHAAQPGAHPDRGRGIRGGGTTTRVRDEPTKPPPTARNSTTLAAETEWSTRLGAAGYARHRAAGTALDLAAAGRAAVTAIRSLQAVEAEEVVLDGQRGRTVESG